MEKLKECMKTGTIEKQDEDSLILFFRNAKSNKVAELVRREAAQ